MVKLLERKGKWGWEESVRVLGGLSAVGLGGAVLGEAGTLIAGFAAKGLAKTEFGQDLIWGIALLNAADLLLQRLIGGRGVVG